MLGLALTLKLAILSLLAWLVFTMFKTPTAGLEISVLIVGMPTAVTAFVLSETYKLDTAFAAMAMLVSTTVSFFTLSILATVL